MAEYKISGESMTAIADAIRAKKGTSTSYTPAQMSSAIQSIVTGTGTGTSDYMVSHIVSQANDSLALTETKSLADSEMYRYGGIVLPKIPQDILETHPYCFIRDAVGDQGVFSLFMSRTPWLFMTAENFPVLTTDGWQEGIYWYDVLSTDAGNVVTWTLKEIHSTSETYNVNSRPLIWTNQNITSLDEADAGTVKYYWSMPVVLGEE